MDTTLGIALRTPLEPSTHRATARPTAPDESLETQSADDGRFAVAAASARGLHHAANEDAVSPLAAAASLFVVADGVGGGALAGLASRMLVASLHDALGAPGAQPLTPDAVRRAVLDADRAIAACIARVTAAPGAATVVLAAPIDAVGGRWLLAWVGDCRAYRLTRGRASVRAARLDLLTRDDTFRHLREAVPSGGSPDDPARMVGNGATGGPNVAVHDLGPGELLALCSDGVHKRLSGADWRGVLLRRLPLVERCRDAVRVARANGSSDDATVLLIERPAPIGLPAEESEASSDNRFVRAVRRLCSGTPARRSQGTAAWPVAPWNEGDER